MDGFGRKQIRLAASSYVGHQWYFLTLCTQARAPRLNDPPLVASTLRLLEDSAQAEGFAVPAYCFMPDHLHLLVNGTREGSNLLRLVRGFKQRSGYSFTQQTRARLWQKKYYDHILRADESWEAVAWYIWMNPVRKKLCERPQDWPFSGSFAFDWQKLLAPPETLWSPPWKQGG